jgi:hypothetical protein
VAADEKRELREIVGVALGATHLESTEGEEHAIERIGALGMSAYGRRDDKLEITLDGELGELLQRWKYGGDASVRGQAAVLLAALIQQRPRLRRRWFAFPGESLMRFVVRVLEEWIDEPCRHCNGVGRSGVSADGQEVKRVDCPDCDGLGTVPIPARGRLELRTWPFLTSMDWKRSADIRRAAARERAKPARERCPGCNGGRTATRTKATPTNLGKVCTRCDGSGKARPEHTRRASALGLDREIYWSEWRRRFTWLMYELNFVDAQVHARLHLQLERRRVPAT